MLSLVPTNCQEIPRSPHACQWARTLRTSQDAPTSAYNASKERWGGVLDAASLVFGILSIFMWPIQYGGFLVSATGLVLGVVMLRRRKSGMAMAGIVLSSIGLALTIINLKIGLLDLILKTYFQY